MLTTSDHCGKYQKIAEDNWVSPSAHFQQGHYSMVTHYGNSPFDKVTNSCITEVPYGLLNKQNNNDINEKRTCKTFKVVRHMHGVGIIIHPPVYDMLAKCKPSTTVVFAYLLKKLKRSSKEVDLPLVQFEKNYGSKRIYYSGIKELIEKEMIYKKCGQVYFVNHNCVFRGSQKAYKQLLESIQKGNEV